ncbi:MAG: c-type cytochrome [Betaproteobacteria bacterium]
MRATITIAALACAALVAGCANPSRSRNLADPSVPALTLAQQVCANCHGAGGSAVSPNFPNLAGQRAEYIAAQLKVFRSHDRRDPAGFEYMWGLSRSLTDEQIDGLARYYAEQPLKRQPMEGRPERIASGKAIFEGGLSAKEVPACASCHGSEAQGNGAFPRLAGQHADYVVKQLNVFQRTDERPEGAVMKVIAHSLDRADIANVADYVQSLAAR